MERPIQVSALHAVLKAFPFFRWNQEKKEVIIQKGEWTIDRPLVFPSQIRVLVEAGTTLKFSKDSYFLTMSPMMMKGTADHPIILKGLRQNQQPQTWQGVVVMQAHEPSTWSHVKIYDTSGIVQPHWSLTGGVTFYQSEIKMTNCQFFGNLAEDALNIVRTNFTLSNVSITQAASDGLDVDFGTGTITGGSYTQIGARGGGDAIDVSGSDVQVQQVKIKGITDKGISVGEASTLKAVDVHIEDTSVGAVSKDGSSLEIHDSQMHKVGTALMAYTKKPEFGPGTVIADKNVWDKRDGMIRVQKGSVIKVDGETVPTEDIDVEGLYKTSMKSGRKK